MISLSFLPTNIFMFFIKFYVNICKNLEFFRYIYKMHDLKQYINEILENHHDERVLALNLMGKNFG